jgi:3alpha(or 20beta)-hydroxysteroid dehydrogenase
MSLLTGKVAIVTGAGQGLGAVIAHTLASNGAKVLLCDINVDSCKRVAAKIGEAAAACRLDVTDSAHWANAVKTCEATFGAPSVLVNNAAIIFRALLEDATENEFDKTMAVNVKGSFLGMKAVIAPMKKNGGGSIVNISSGNGFMAMPETTTYVASKFAVRGLTRNGALELAKYGIRVNDVCPGFIRTSMTSAEDESLGRKIAPLQRIAEPDEIAAMVLFLASDQSSYATGADFVIDGGVLSGFTAYE